MYLSQHKNTWSGQNYSIFCGLTLMTLPKKPTLALCWQTLEKCSTGRFPSTHTHTHTPPLLCQQGYTPVSWVC